MPQLKFTRPCNDCPFRRAAARGWLGAETDPQVFVDGALADHCAPWAELPCHATIDYTDPRWRDTQYPDAALCAGAVIFCKNQGKMPRDLTRAANVRAVERDTATVFATPEEFIEHHSGDDKQLRRRLAGERRRKSLP